MEYRLNHWLLFYQNRAVDEEEVLEEEVDDEGGEAVFHDSDREDDFEPVADASQEVEAFLLSQLVTVGDVGARQI